ncbi:unnamed protein product [Caenorhabditis brenneri]
MIDKLVLKEEIIDCFYSCAEKADYRQLFNNYPKFFEVLVENMVTMELHMSTHRSICQAITKNTKHLLIILRQWHSSQPTFCQELIDMEEEFPEFIGHFRECGSVKDWNDFYRLFNLAADTIIAEARNKEVLDFKIESAGILFDSFKKRDMFLEHGEKLRNELMIQIRGELKLSETKHEEDGQRLKNELSQIKEELELSRAKLEEDGQNLRNELMNRFECQAQQMENRISETNEKIESMNEKLALFNSLFNVKFNSLEEQLDSMQLVKKIGAWKALKYQNMAALLVLTEEMIECFHSCANKADYRQLFNKYPGFFYVLVEYLEIVEFPLLQFLFANSICPVIAKNSRHLLNILRHWHSGETSFCEELIVVDQKYPEFLAHFKDMGSVKDWNDFYNTYKSTADVVITDARQQEIIDFKIECKGALFDDFEDRDNFLKSYQGTEPEPQEEEKKEENHGSNLQQLEIKIQKQLKAQEEQMKLREDKLRMREDELDEKVNEIRSMEAHLDEKIEEIKLREKKLGRKLEEMMETMKLVVGNQSTDNTIDSSKSDFPEDVNNIESGVSQSDPIIKIVHPPVQTATAVLVDHEPISEDDDLQQMEEQFQKDLAEQNRVFEMKLKIAQERRREMNERAEEERNRISENLQSAAPFRRSFH